MALTYYNLSTGWFHKIFGAHYSMGIQFPTENLASARPGETRVSPWTRVMVKPVSRDAD